MTGFFIAALIMGGMASMHCIGMCGPLAMSLPAVGNSQSSWFVSTLLYNTGRVITYTLLGLAAGTIGKGFSFFGMQQWISITLGILILLVMLLPKQWVNRQGRVNAFITMPMQWLSKLFYRRNYHSVLAIGLLNGLLPCGMVYLALAAAISAGSTLKSSLFMAGFGLGTLPVMWSVGFFGSMMNYKVRSRIRKLYPLMMCVMAVLLIARGLGLEIPYLSPGKPADGMGNALNCHD
jgi:uncharacterized protein